MPVKNTIKSYVENGYYHIYNRGIDKREIFLDTKDCSVFLYYVKLYLASPESLLQDTSIISPKLIYKVKNLNLHAEVILLSFALMPNHFHLQIKQVTSNGIEKLMRRVLTSYVQYFNRKYHRQGPLFESTYKAVLTTTDTQHVYLSSYIHRNPMKLKNSVFDFIEFSSYPYYLQKKQSTWVNTQDILGYFRSSRNVQTNDLLSYQNFVESVRESPEDMLKDLTLEVG